MAQETSYSKLVSVRLDNRVVDLLEKKLRAHRFWSRSAMMNQVLLAVLDCIDYSTLEKILRYRKSATQRYLITFDKVEPIHESSM